jgi:hypothetical protein
MKPGAKGVSLKQSVLGSPSAVNSGIITVFVVAITGRTAKVLFSWIINKANKRPNLSDYDKISTNVPYKG